MKRDGRDGLKGGAKDITTRQIKEESGLEKPQHSACVMVEKRVVRGFRRNEVAMTHQTAEGSAKTKEGEVEENTAILAKISCTKKIFVWY